MDFLMKMIGYKELSQLGDPLEKLNKVIDWESFRHSLNKIFKKDAKGPVGRLSYDYVVMFKALILQRLYGISDAQAEYHIKDRLSLCGFWDSASAIQSRMKKQYWDDEPGIQHEPI